MKEKIKKITTVPNMIGLVSILLSTYSLFQMLQMDILPIKYLILIFSVVYIMNILFIVLIHLKKKPVRILGYIFLTIMMIMNVVVNFYLKSTNHFLNQAFDNATNINEVTYYVVVNKKSSYRKISDLKKKNLNYYQEEKNIKKAISKLDRKVKTTSKACNDIGIMFDDLKTNQIDAILVSQTYYDLITSIDNNYSKDNYKILYQFKLYEKIDTNQSNNLDSFNIFIGGKDFTNTNMDFNMIMTINTKTHEVLLTGMPRDYYIEVDGYQGKKDTLSYMGALGIDTNIKSIEKLFNIKIDYYLSIRTTSLVELVDEVGGINYCSDEEYTTTHSMILNSYDDSKGNKLHVKKGCQHLNGIETLTVARERKNVYGGDRKRQENCQAIIIDIFEQLISTNTLTNYNNILNSLSNLYETTIPKKLITSMVKDTVQNGNQWKFETQAVSGEDTKDNVHMTNLKDWVTYPDMNTVNSATAKINKVFNHE